MDATPTGAAAKKAVSTASLYVDRVPTEEWAQIFDEVWRRYRDFFYAPNMHGYDWEALRKQYRPWLAARGAPLRPELRHQRDDLRADGAARVHRRRRHASSCRGRRSRWPGARFELDTESDRYRISRIFHGQNEEEIYRSPLTEIGVDAKVGDYVLAINGAGAEGQGRSVPAAAQRGGQSRCS